MRVSPRCVARKPRPLLAPQARTKLPFISRFRVAVPITGRRVCSPPPSHVCRTIETAVESTDRGSVCGTAEESGRQLALHDSESKVRSRDLRWENRNHERITLVNISSYSTEDTDEQYRRLTLCVSREQQFKWMNIRMQSWNYGGGRHWLFGKCRHQTQE